MSPSLPEVMGRGHTAGFILPPSPSPRPAPLLYAHEVTVRRDENHWAPQYSFCQGTQPFKFWRKDEYSILQSNFEVLGKGLASNNPPLVWCPCFLTENNLSNIRFQFLLSWPKSPFSFFHKIKDTFFIFTNKFIDLGTLIMSAISHRV